MRGAVKYFHKGNNAVAQPIWLCKGSVAFELYQLPKQDKLVAHMKQLDKNAQMLEQYGRYEPTKEMKQ